MTKTAHKIISDAMLSLGLEYALGVYNGNEDGEIVYPYFVGEYQDLEPLYESGLTETTFLLNGFTRGTWQELEEAKAKIEKHFNKISGKTVMVDDGSAVIIFYASALIVPTGDAELKRIQINLSVKEWSVN